MDTAADVEARLPIRSDMDLAWVRQHVRQAATRVASCTGTCHTRGITCPRAAAPAGTPRR